MSYLQHILVERLGITVEAIVLFNGAVNMINIFTVPLLLQHVLCYRSFNSSVCHSLGLSGSHFAENMVQAETAKWLMVLSLSNPLLSIITSLFVGPACDIIGKRKATYMYPTLTLAQGIIFVVLSRFVSNLHPAWLVVATFLPALAGDHAGAQLVAFAYKSDTTTKSERTKGLSRPESLTFLVNGLMPLLAGFLIKKSGYTAVYSLHLLLSTLSVLYIYFVLPEESSLSTEEDTTLLNDYEMQDDDQNLNQGKGHSVDNVGPAKNTLILLLSFRQIKDLLYHQEKKAQILTYMLIFVIILPPCVEYGILVPLYLKHFPLSQSAEQIGIILAIILVVQAIGLLIVLPAVQNRFNLTDNSLILLGCAAAFSIQVSLGAIRSKDLLYVSCLPFSLLVLFSPTACRSFITKCLSNEMHGSALGVLASLNSIAEAMVSLLGSFIYRETVSFYPGFVFYVFAVMALCGFLITLSARLKGWSSAS